MHVELVLTSLALRTSRVSMLNNLLITHYTVWQTNRALFFQRMRAPTRPKGRTNCNDSLALLTISPPALLLQAPASLALSAASCCSRLTVPQTLQGMQPLLQLAPHGLVARSLPGSHSSKQPGLDPSATG